MLNPRVEHIILQTSPKKAHRISTLDVMKISLYTEFQTKIFLKTEVHGVKHFLVIKKTCSLK